ncbi:hypothetical protein [Luteolibacter marinus]|uniref:hypothetical protein n=1 Tax=Luteolibacter marinus TaxID=2776705 RepID=UPI001868FEE6|nr:hypothetical protein [Luteolibacter marinus]
MSVGNDCHNKPYRALDPEKLVGAASRLALKIEAIFPDSGLARLSREVACLTRETVVRLTFIQRPNWPLRIGVAVLVVIAVLGPLLFSAMLQFRETIGSLGDFLEATDAGMQMLLLLGGSILFLVSLESRMRRNRALEAIAEFRSMAHLVDMHQINKDPGIDLRPPPEGIDRRTVRSDAQLEVYLDHASDLLSLIGKLAAYYGQHLRDRVVLDAVNEIETLTTGLSAKLWQKILLVHELCRNHRPAALVSVDGRPRKGKGEVGALSPP